MTGPLISPDECAAILGISHATVRALVREGKWAVIGAGAVQSSTRWTYVIPRAGFARLIAGELSIVVHLHTHKHVDPDAIGQAVLTAVETALTAA